MTTTRITTRLFALLLLCSVACAGACSRRDGGASPAPPQTGAMHHVALVDSIAAHTSSPLGKFDARQLVTKKYLFIYFASHRNETSLRFTPRLAAFYHDVCQNGDNDIGVIFVSTDRAQRDANSFMHDTAMPWPGVRVNSPASIELRKRYAGPGEPCLVLLDENDKVLATSHTESGPNLPARPITTYQKLKQPDQKKSNARKK